jgi:hypothetical protein
MHDCPNCGQACDCDGEDTWFNNYPGCLCDCEDLAIDDDDDDFDSSPDDYGYCMVCGRPTSICICNTPEDPRYEEDKKPEPEVSPDELSNP